MVVSMFTKTPCVFTIEEHTGPYTIPCEVGLEKFVHINTGLRENQQAQLLKVLKKQAGAFAWEYTNMKGIHHDTYIQHIYMDPIMIHVTCKADTEEDESLSKGYSKRRITKAPHCWFHLSYFRR